MNIEHTKKMNELTEDRDGKGKEGRELPGDTMEGL